MTTTQWRCTAGHATQQEPEPPRLTCGCSWRTATPEALTDAMADQARADTIIAEWDATHP